ncbi:hypothetical protein D3C81_1808630 [compost metagenome]
MRASGASGVARERNAVAAFHFLPRLDQQLTQVHVAGGIGATVTNGNVVPCRAAAFCNDHFTVTDREHWRALRHRKVNATVRRDTASDRVQTTRVKVG